MSSRRSIGRPVHAVCAGSVSSFARSFTRCAGRQPIERNSRDDLDRVADAQAERIRRARSAHRKLHQTGAVLVPKSTAVRHVREYPGIGELASPGGYPCVARNAARAQTGERVAEMVDVDDFGEILGSQLDAQSRAILDLVLG